MSVALISSAHIQGLEANLVKVEIDLSSGLYSFNIVGLPDKAVEESKDRVVAALKNSDLGNPKTEHHKIVISLAPADIKKEGSHFDVPIAIGYLISAKKISNSVENKLFIGELSLNGNIESVYGALAITELAKEKGFEEIYVPHANKEEAALISGIKVYAVKNLGELVKHLDGKEEFKLLPVEKTNIIVSRPDYFLDFKDVRGQETAKRALVIAATGGHNIALYGPPGTGKTMLARAYAGIMPKLSEKEILEITRIHSIAGKNSKLVTQPPFRSPHHTSSYVSLVGGGTNPRPGEITLAHRGILFLDEFPEFDKKVIESLREPLEEGKITVSRAKGTLVFPARSTTIVALNPCPCGYYGSKTRKCVCRQADIEKYIRKLSGPIIDRIDIWVPVQNIDYELLSQNKGGEDTSEIREHVRRAREFGEARYNGKPASLNRDLNGDELREHTSLTDEDRKLLNELANKFKLSPRSYHRILRVARSIADLDNKKQIETSHIMEAFQYRPKIFSDLLE